MLEKIDLTKKMEKKEAKKILEELEPKLASLQRECRAAGIPVIIVFEGFGASGKGTLINRLIHPLDPRGFQVYAIGAESKEEKRRPRMWRFWVKTPEKGRIAIFDRSWYQRVLIDRFEGITSKQELSYAYQEIVLFERQLADAGNVILKFFLDITEEEQTKRFEKLLGRKETTWRVSKGDLKRNKHFAEYSRMNEEMLQKTDTDFAPWMIVEAMDREYAAVKILRTVIDRLEQQLKKVKSDFQSEQEIQENKQVFKSSILNNVDLSCSYTKDEYKERLKKLQGRLNVLHSELYRRKTPVVLGFEGWDAGGKGGAIKRLAEALDPRGYAVNPVAAPNDTERLHHYLWRFWQNMPKSGHIAIFDRTWYGRVMVERIEGFCSQIEWKRAYKEINDMETELVHGGAIVLKFWMQIDKDEQERRFRERTDTPDKQWKVTEEDWRNREKWDAYEEAVDEMLIRTSTIHAPWILVEGNNKYYARIKVLETVIEAIEKQMG